MFLLKYIISRIEGFLGYNINILSNEEKDVNTWNLSNYYQTYEDFKKAISEAKEIVGKFSVYQGKLGDEKYFLDYYALQENIQRNYLKLYLYAMCHMDQDHNNNAALSDMQEVSFLFNQFSQATSFEEPEIISLGLTYVFNILNNHPELEPLRFAFENVFRKASHVLSAEGQAIIANFGQLMGSGYDTYEAITSGDHRAYYAKLDDGSKTEITMSNWTKLVSEAKSPKVRKNIFEAMFIRFSENKNTMASIYKSVLDADIALAKSKKFETALDMHLFENNIPTSLYTNLINAAHKMAPLAKRYYRLRKKTLGLKSYHTYDRFLPLAPESNKQYTYEEARNLFFDSIKKFDPEFQEFAHEASKEGYIDVFPATGKRGGAYSNNVPGVHPCILLNFTGTLNDCFTLAHESGHSIHTLFSEKYQPIWTQSYTIFVAEIASTFNEQNLLDYLIGKGELSKNDKISLIQNGLDDIMGTFYRQTLFAEYELIAHTRAEKGESITADSLSEIMINLYKQYYGLDIRKEKVKEFVWAYIPHFHESPYYVYQYATSFSASLQIYENVKQGQPDAFKNYESLLKSGGSDYPINLVKRAGVDFNKMDAIKGVGVRFKELLDELEGALEE